MVGAKSLENLNTNLLGLKNEQFSNVLGMAWENALDSFSMFKWVFHQLKELQLKQTTMGSKLNVIESLVKCKNIDEVPFAIG